MIRPARLLTLLLLLATPAPAQSTWYVDAGGTSPGSGTPDDPFASIQEAHDALVVQPLDELRVAGGTYTENLHLTKSLRIIGEGPDRVVVDGGLAGEVLILETSLYLEGMTLRAGRAAGISARPGSALEAAGVRVEDCIDGGGILAEGASIELTGCELLGNAGPSGAGLHALGCDVLLEECIVSGNVSHGQQGGGVRFVEGTAAHTLTIRSSAIRTNTVGGTGLRSSGLGGGLYVDGGLDMESTSLAENKAFLSGGGCFATSSSRVRVTGSMYTSNRAQEAWGPLDLTWGSGGGHQGPGRFSDCSFEDNRASVGGAVHGAGLAELTHCEFIGNQARGVLSGGFGPTPAGTVRGGAVADSAVHSSLFSRNTARLSSGATTPFAYGGAVSGGQITSCTLEDNVAYGAGGGASNAELRDCLLHRNMATRGGGAADCELTGCELIGNQGAGLTGDGLGADAAQGGGLSGGTAQGCLIAENTAVPPSNGWGGGAHAAILEACVLRSNRASRGGGVTSCTLVQCTLVDNEATGLYGQAPGGHAVDDEGGIASVLDSCIVWGHGGGRGFDVLLGQPLVTDSIVEVSVAGTGNTVEDPLFWYPVTFDVHLKPGSPAIDAGNPNLPPDADGSLPDRGALPFDAGHAPEPVRFCEGGFNSVGTRAALSTSGYPTLTGPDDFRLTVESALPGQVGVFLWSPGAAPPPFTVGALCLEGDIQRSSPILLGAGSGTYLLDQAALAATLGPAFTSGYAQFWYRDPASPNTSALSDALEFTVRP